MAENAGVLAVKLSPWSEAMISQVRVQDTSCCSLSSVSDLFVQVGDAIAVSIDGQRQVLRRETNLSRSPQRRIISRWRSSG